MTKEKWRKIMSDGTKITIVICGLMLFWFVMQIALINTQHSRDLKVLELSDKKSKERMEIEHNNVRELIELKARHKETK